MFICFMLVIIKHYKKNREEERILSVQLKYSWNEYFVKKKMVVSIKLGKYINTTLNLQKKKNLVPICHLKNGYVLE